MGSCCPSCTDACAGSASVRGIRSTVTNIAYSRGGSRAISSTERGWSGFFRWCYAISIQTRYWDPQDSTEEGAKPSDEHSRAFCYTNTRRYQLHIFSMDYQYPSWRSLCSNSHSCNQCLHCISLSAPCRHYSTNPRPGLRPPSWLPLSTLRHPCSLLRDLRAGQQ